MIVVTLICVVLGGVTDAVLWSYHVSLGRDYRSAMWRPWTLVKVFSYEELHTGPGPTVEQAKAKALRDEDEKWAAQVEKLRSEQTVRPSSSAPAPNPPKP